MAKMTSDKQKTAVAEWLAAEGYGLEYHAYNAFKNQGIKTTMGVTFENDEERFQVDVCASSATRSGGELDASSCVVSVVCHCIPSENRPWILLRSSYPQSLTHLWSALPKSKRIAAKPRRIEEYEAHLKGSPHFLTHTHQSHNLVQALGDDGQHLSFQTLRKLSACSWAMAERPKMRTVLQVVIPCLVVDSSLYEGRFNADSGKFDVRSVPFGRIAWEGFRGGTMIDVVRVSALDDYVTGVVNTISSLPPVMRKMVSSL
jgi:hypothetical protein